MNVVWVSVVAFTVNVPLGKWRSGYRKFSMPWFLLVHASIPLVVALRILLGTPYAFVPLFIALAVAGQLIGAYYYRRTR